MNGGVIIIGSLLWADDYKKNDSIRKKWRKSQLDIENGFRVKLPIRYGRRSKGGEFTMVFSTRLEKSENLGVGYIIPFRNNPIMDYEQLEMEAESMAIAEGFGNKKHPRFFTSWGGALGLMFNEKKVRIEQRNVFTLDWEKRFIIDKRDYCDKDFRVNRERKSIREENCKSNGQNVWIDETNPNWMD